MRITESLIDFIETRPILLLSSILFLVGCADEAGRERPLKCLLSDSLGAAYVDALVKRIQSLGPTAPTDREVLEALGLGRLWPGAGTAMMSNERRTLTISGDLELQLYYGPMEYRSLPAGSDLKELIAASGQHPPSPWRIQEVALCCGPNYVLTKRIWKLSVHSADSRVDRVNQGIRQAAREALLSHWLPIPWITMALTFYVVPSSLDAVIDMGPEIVPILKQIENSDNIELFPITVAAIAIIEERAVKKCKIEREMGAGQIAQTKYVFFEFSSR